MFLKTVHITKQVDKNVLNCTRICLQTKKGTEIEYLSPLILKEVWEKDMIKCKPRRVKFSEIVRLCLSKYFIHIFSWKIIQLLDIQKQIKPTFTRLL